MRHRNTKFIFVTGGIVSGIGKGITVAAIGSLLKARGISVFPVKIDPYLNRDAGTMNPYQHGEVFVTDDGAETDCDLGHYERFLNMNLDRRSNFTSGAVYERVIQLERRGDFLGKTIQIIPHITDEIKRRILYAARTTHAEVVIVEIGGTVGDIEAEPFLEAARQMLREYGSTHVLFLHVVKVDYLSPSDEEKTKPIQQSVTLLRARGIQPDMLVVRCKRPLTRENIEKISLFTNVQPHYIVPAIDVPTIYDVPVHFRKSKLDISICERLHLPRRKARYGPWDSMVLRMRRATRECNIALVGKYVQHVDAYISVEEALKIAAASECIIVHIHHIDAEHETVAKACREMDGIVVPGGFGSRGIEGKIEAVQYARMQKIPFLGLCLGLQVAVIEFARHVCNLKKAHSTEFDMHTPHPVIDILRSQKNVRDLGGTLRLGALPMRLVQGSRAADIYGVRRIRERHRHRYEVNPQYHDRLQQGGLIFSGMAENDARLVDMIELPGHPFFIATQAHPEFRAHFLGPHSLFVAFLRAVCA